tara:strand:+ start:145 stop:2262 length:2118 start_codon:yes stop_codon:yes gene_type:complete
MKDSNPFDIMGKIREQNEQKNERINKFFNEFQNIFLQLKNDEINQKEFLSEFERILPHNDDLVEEGIAEKYEVLQDCLKKTTSYLKEIMNQLVDSGDLLILESIIDVIHERWKEVKNNVVDMMMEHQDEWDTLDVNIEKKLSEKEKENWWSERQYGLGHKRLSKETLKKVMNYLLNEFRDWDEDFEAETLHKDGGLQIHKNETRREIFKRIEKNLMQVPQTYRHTPRNPRRSRVLRKRWNIGDPDKILIVLVLTIIEIKQGKRRVDGILKKFSKLTYHDTKRSSQLEIFYNKYNKKKNHGHRFLLLACLQYLTRPMSSKQKTMLRKRRGIDSHWASQFTWDYFETYKKIYGDTDFSQEEFGGKLPFNEYAKKQLQMENENVLNEFVNCVKKGYIKFNFHYFISLEKNFQKALIKYLEVEFAKKKANTQTKEQFDDENLNIGQFIGGFREKCKEFSVEYIKKWAEHDDREEIRGVVDVNADEFSKIQYMFEWKKNGWYITKDEGETIEFKSNFYRPPPAIHTEYKKEKKDWEKKGKKDEPFQKESTFTKIKEKEFEIELMKEICAFLNHKGGQLFFGIEDSTGLVFGIDRDKESKYRGLSDKKFRDDHERRIKQTIKNHFGSALGPGEIIKVKLIGPLPYNKKWFVLIDVPATRDCNFDLAKSWSPNGGFSKTKCFVYRDGSNSEWECDATKYVAKIRNTEEGSDD